MKTIWKFPLTLNAIQVIDMPHEAVILSIQEQNGLPTIWAEVNTQNSHVDRYFRMVGTGKFDDKMQQDMGRKYIGTVQISERGLPLVLHIFEVASQ